ncbi:hypothetical protein ES703_20202 [subsurface metagenome]
MDKKSAIVVVAVIVIAATYFVVWFIGVVRATIWDIRSFSPS